MSSGNDSISTEILPPLLGGLGAAASLIFCVAGAAYGTAKTGSGFLAPGSKNSFKLTIIPVMMSGVISIYGLIISILITTNIGKDGYSYFHGAVDLAAGLTVGLCGLASACAVGCIGAAGTNTNADCSEEKTNLVDNTTVRRPIVNTNVQEILILIFAEALGLYGLIVALLLHSKAKIVPAEA